MGLKYGQHQHDDVMQLSTLGLVGDNLAVHVLKNDAAVRNVFPDLRLRRSFAANRKALSGNRKASIEDAESF